MGLQECADKITTLWKEIAEQFGKLAEQLRKAFKKIEQREKQLHRPPKLYVKANNPIMVISRSRVFHCRNNC